MVNLKKNLQSDGHQIQLIWNIGANLVYLVDLALILPTILYVILRNNVTNTSIHAELKFFELILSKLCTFCII